MEDAVGGAGAALAAALEAFYALVPPAWLLATLLALGNVFLFRAVAGREGHSAAYFVPWGVLGFALGNLLAVWLGSRIPTFGDVHVVEASVGAWLLLSAANLRPPA
ncbi:MAG TPA: hypothetical protein VFX49_18640 [Chloroflexota bacterium]|nr:hypothetical protein [Chloroflexota bacterium]